MTSEVAQGGWSGGRGGAWGIGVLEVKILYRCWGVDISVGEPHIIGVQPPNKLDQVPQLAPPEPGVKDLFNFIFLLIVNSDRTRLQRLRVLHNFIRDVGVDAGDGYNGVDVLLLCREAEFDSSWGDDLGNGERTSPLVV